MIQNIRNVRHSKNITFGTLDKIYFGLLTVKIGIKVVFDEQRI